MNKTKLLLCLSFMLGVTGSLFAFDTDEQLDMIPVPKAQNFGKGIKEVLGGLHSKVSNHLNAPLTEQDQLSVFGEAPAVEAPAVEAPAGLFIAKNKYIIGGVVAAVVIAGVTYYVYKKYKEKKAEETN